jgi:hypothetical protein
MTSIYYFRIYFLILYVDCNIYATVPRILMLTAITRCYNLSAISFVSGVIIVTLS